jgi:chitinase
MPPTPSQTPKPAPFFESPTGKRAIYYHTSWACYGRDFHVRQLPIDKLTDVAYAFFNVGADGRVFSGDAWADFDNPLAGKGVDPQNAPPHGNLGQFAKLRAAGKRFNMTLAVGGWSWSGRFSEAVATAQTRETFVASLVDVFGRYPGLFNGVSVDWEYVSDDGKNYGLDGNTARPEDAANLVRLLKLLRARLPGFRLSLCVTAAPEKIKMPVAKIHPLVEEIHVMTYDFMDGRWGGGVAGHQANLRPAPGCPYSVEQAVAAWRALGVPARKLFVGAAFYSRGFSGTDGLGKPCTGGSPDKSWEDGVVDYKALPLPGAKELWDPVAQAGYSYDAAKRVLNSYDTPRSVLEKCRFVHAQDLGGVLVWESSGDHPFEHPRSLMRVIHQNLTHGRPPPVK